jgi:type III pantothenate kinase
VSAPILTIDLGNSSAKLRLWGAASERAPTCLARRDERDPAGPDLAGWIARHRPARALLASVASPDRSAALRALVEEVVPLRVGPPSSLENRCRVPGSVGEDRLFAALGAAWLLERSCIVVDAGTALTVDAVERAAERPAFLGGAIAPGPALLADALAHGTARLPRIEPRPGARALGTDTEEALASGVSVGFRGAARALVEGVAREATLRAAPIVLTGGARSFLLEPRPFVEGELVVEEDLVHLGMLAELALEVRGATR